MEAASAHTTQDHLDRTSAHRARMEQRRQDLHQQLTRILPDNSHFVWELGCGHGHFLTAYAQAHPHQLCVGIDIVSERIERALRKRDRAKLSNLFFVHAEARLFLDTLPHTSAFSELFILFPDPWPKSRHHKHRILQPDFLSTASRRATRDCRLCFRTDFAPYFDDAQKTVHSHPHWKAAEEPWPFEFNTVFQSRAANYQSLIARHSRNPHHS